MRIERTRTTIIGTAAALALAAATPAAAHFVTVTPAGGDNCVVRHVGETNTGGHEHHSRAGHTRAAGHEQSAAVRFGAPGTC